MNLVELGLSVLTLLAGTPPSVVSGQKAVLEPDLIVEAPTTVTGRYA